MRPYIPWVLLVVLATFGIYLYGNERARTAEAKLEASQAKEAAAKWQAQSGKWTAVYVPIRDTIRVRVTRYTEARDTLVITDTVQVQNVLSLADSTIKACGQAITVCDSIQVAKDSQIAALNRQIKAEIKRRPGFFQKIGGKLIWVAGGVILGKAF